MDVIIVSKTHMSNASCVGGVLANGRFVRLLNENGYNQDADTKLNVGDVWTIDFHERNAIRPPHTEDILVINWMYKFSFETIDLMVNYLVDKLKVKVWRGNPDLLFDGCLQWTNGGSGYISESGDIPTNSVGFWIPDSDLIRKDYDDKIRYSYPMRWRSIKYVGFQDPIDRIPVGTLTRVSLARWWSPSEGEERCYLQLSGWYMTGNQNAEEKVFDDLPF